MQINPKIAFLFFSSAKLALGQQANARALTNQQVVELEQKGVCADELRRIITSAQEVSFYLTPEGTNALLKAGVPDNVIQAMAAREHGSPVEQSMQRSEPASPTNSCPQPVQLGDNAAPGNKTREFTDSVFTLLIYQKHGLYSSSADSEARAFKDLVAYVRREWSKHFVAPVPTADEQAVDNYFTLQNGNEDYEIVEHELLK